MKNPVRNFIALICAAIFLIAIPGLVGPSLAEEPQGNSASGEGKPAAGGGRDTPTPAANVAFKDTALTLTLNSSNIATGNVFLQNTGELAADVVFTVVLARGEAEVIPSDDKRIGSEDIRAFPISISLKKGTAPLNGYLKLEATSIQPQPKKKATVLAIKINPPPQPPPSANLVWAPLIAASMLTLISFGLVYFKKSISPFARMGSPTWTFKDSWASNITVASGALTTLLTFSSLPDNPLHFSKTGYAVLSFLFAALIGLAPIVYNLIRKEIVAVDTAGNEVVQHQGFVISFLLACLLTIWGVIGQIITLWFNLDEIWKAGLVIQTIIQVFQWLLIFTGVLLSGYAAVSIIRTIKRQRVVEKETHSRAVSSLRKKAIAEAQPIPEGELVNVKPALPDWPLL